MLTRLEVRGFKNLRDVAIDFGPFTCIAGPNGVGKSNVFDAIRFLAELADHPLMEAAERIRATRSDRAADPRDLFWDARADGRIAFAAEMLIDPVVVDDFGSSAEATSTFLRYELEIGFEPPSGIERRGRLVLHREELKHITVGDSHAHLRFPHSAQRFRRQVVDSKRRGVAYISTRQTPVGPEITVHQDGGSRGQPRRGSAAKASATIVRSTSVIDDPTILAARREMQRWRLLGLEPTALRTEDGFSDARSISADGRHLPATLYRIATGAANQGRTEEDVYASISNRLKRLTGLDIGTVQVDVDDARELLTLRLRDGSGKTLPARSLSEGTLRFLALCVMHEDPSAVGVICMEEPENGIHPANIAAMVDLLRDLAIDPMEPPGADNPLRQIVINTHSPAVVQQVGADDLLVAQATTPAWADPGDDRPALRLRALRDTWRGKQSDADTLSELNVLDYLTFPAGAQLSLTA